MQRERAALLDYWHGSNAREWCSADPGLPRTVTVTVPVLQRITSCCAAPGTRHQSFRRLAAPEAEPLLGLPQDEAQHHAGDRDQHQQCEHRCEVEAEIGLQDEHADAALGADELAHDGADHGEHDAGVEAGHDVGERVRQLHVAQKLSARAAHRADERDAVGIDRAQAGDGVDQAREQAGERHDEDLRLDAEAEPHDHERRDRDLRHGLQRHHVRINEAVEHGHLHHRDAEQDAAERADGEPAENLAQRDSERVKIGAAGDAVPQRGRDGRGGREDIGLHVEIADAGFQEQHEHGEGEELSLIHI